MAGKAGDLLLLRRRLPHEHGKIVGSRDESLRSAGERRFVSRERRTRLRARIRRHPLLGWIIGAGAKRIIDAQRERIYPMRVAGERAKRCSNVCSPYANGPILKPSKLSVIFECDSSPVIPNR